MTKELNDKLEAEARVFDELIRLTYFGELNWKLVAGGNAYIATFYPMLTIYVEALPDDKPRLEIRDVRSVVKAEYISRHVYRLLNTIRAVEGKEKQLDVRPRDFSNPKDFFEFLRESRKYRTSEEIKKAEEFLGK